MHKKGGKVLYSASDMMAFIECQHLVTLNLINLETPLTRAETNEKTALIQDKGFAHEAGYLSQLRSSGLDIVE